MAHPLHYYQVLQLTSTDATADEVKRAYRRLSLRLHPDRNPDPAATEHFQSVLQAFEVLKTPGKRAVYDAFGVHGLQLYASYLDSSRLSGEHGHDGEVSMQPMKLLAFTCVLLTLVVLAIGSMTLLLLLRHEGQMHTPLAIILAPAWVVCCGALCGIGASMAKRRAESRPTLQSRPTLLLLQLASVFIFLLLLCFKMDSKMDSEAPRISWRVAFLPIFALALSAELQWWRAAGVRGGVAGVDDHPARDYGGGYGLPQLGWVAIRVGLLLKKCVFCLSLNVAPPLLPYVRVQKSRKNFFFTGPLFSSAGESPLEYAAEARSRGGL